MNQELLNNTKSIEAIASEFPILKVEVNNNNLVYLDNGSTTHKPLSVLKAIDNLYTRSYSNIHRGVHTLSQKSTLLYEEARRAVAKYINADREEEIIFTSGTTESINLIAHSYGRKFVQRGDVILVSAMEHHSNILPWQMLCEEKGAVLKVIPISKSGEILFEEYKKLLSEKVKLVAITAISNTLGTVNDIKSIISNAHQVGAVVAVDAAQAIAHQKVDVQDWKADFVSFSGHKMYAPTGIGVLFGKLDLLNQMPPYKGGGGIIKTVSFEKVEYADVPLKFEAGTPNIEGAIGLKAAIDFISQFDFNEIEKHEAEIVNWTVEHLKAIPEVELVGEPNHRCGIISFNVKGCHPMDVGVLLDKQGVAVRTGHHCTQPLMQFYRIQGTIRVSFGIYNTLKDAERFIFALQKSIKMLL